MKHDEAGTSLPRIAGHYDPDESKEYRAHDGAGTELDRAARVVIEQARAAYHNLRSALMYFDDLDRAHDDSSGATMVCPACKGEREATGLGGANGCPRCDATGRVAVPEPTRELRSCASCRRLVAEHTPNEATACLRALGVEKHDGWKYPGAKLWQVSKLRDVQSAVEKDLTEPAPDETGTDWKVIADGLAKELDALLDDLDETESDALAAYKAAVDSSAARLFPNIADPEAELRKYLFPGTRIERRWVIDRYEAGEPIDQVAFDFGLDVAMVRRELCLDGPEDGPNRKADEADSREGAVLSGSSGPSAPDEPSKEHIWEWKQTPENKYVGRYICSVCGEQQSKLVRSACPGAPDETGTDGCGIRWVGGLKCPDHICAWCENDGKRHVCKCGASLHGIWVAPDVVDAADVISWDEGGPGEDRPVRSGEVSSEPSPSPSPSRDVHCGVLTPHDEHEGCGGSVIGERHRCDLPSKFGRPEGTLARCDVCGRYYELAWFHGKFWRSVHLTPNDMILLGTPEKGK